jgi:hypothetical protein
MASTYKFWKKSKHSVQNNRRPCSLNTLLVRLKMVQPLWITVWHFKKLWLQAYHMLGVFCEILYLTKILLFGMYSRKVKVHTHKKYIYECS